MEASTVVANVGDHVWIKPSSTDRYELPWSGKIVSKKKDSFTICGDETKNITVKPEEIMKLVNTTDILALEDMIHLSDLQEYSILRNILLRYYKDQIYTYIGGILVAVNPYKSLPIYSDLYIKRYYNKRSGELPPHIFAVGAQALTNMKRQQCNQCVIISGETGAGKTESTKFLLNFLAAVSSKTIIGNQIVQSNPILEGFGNAKTTKNDNSSRFGKYIEVSYNQEGVITGACIQHYLLEKSRIKSQNIGDRNYHIFYDMLGGLPELEKKKLQLGRPNDYFYLKQGGKIVCQGHDEKVEFLHLKEAMSILNFKNEEIEHIFEMLAAILHIGNFIYKSKVVGNDDITEVQPTNSLKAAITLLGLEENDLIHVLTHKTIIVEGNKVVSAILIGQALSKRDAFAMGLYMRLFSYVLTTINKAISNHQSTKNSTIGILDVFGFENFKHNSFEQLCINYANEQLQQFFVQHVFMLEQEEYQSEGIDWTNLEFQDNQAVVEFLGGKNISVLGLVDEQTRVPKGSDIGYLVKMNQTFSDINYYIKDKSEVSMEFGIRHYAGTVKYNVEGFIEKNVSTLGVDWLEIIRKSSNSFLKTLFGNELSTSVKPVGHTLASQYRTSLEALMKMLNQCYPFFIRCIKPNNHKKTSCLDRPLVSKQLHYSGMMETAKIRQSGYPIRYTYRQFVERYRLLLPGCAPISKIQNWNALALHICSKNLSKEEYHLGKTKVFLKITDELLESLREKVLSKNAVILQKNYKSHLYRKKFIQMRNAAITLQRHWRGRNPRKAFLDIRIGYLRLQACLRSRQLRNDFVQMRIAIIKLQARCRGYLLRKKMNNIKFKKRQSLTPPISSPRSGPNSVNDIDNWIENVFDSAVEEKSEYFQISEEGVEAINVKEILENPCTMTFHKYAAINFTGNVHSRYFIKKIKQPLLELTSFADQLAAVAIWETILRFMGDIANGDHSHYNFNNKSVMSQLHATISKSYLHSKKYIDAYNAFKEEEEKLVKHVLINGPINLINLTLAHRNKLQKEIEKGDQEVSILRENYDKWLNSKSTLLDKLQFIIGHGILRQTLRDEIYCQLCKQLSDNPNPNSSQYGWILMNLCASCFAPSSKFAPTLLHFMASNGNKLGCIMTLQRTIHNGPRNEPPTSFELNALKTKQPMEIKVLFPNGSSLVIKIDAATTSSEVCRKVTSHLGIKDQFGFSLFITMFGKSLSLESGGCHILDAVFLCETVAKERGIPESEAPWYIRFAKEMFSPWQTHLDDLVAADLVYSQVIKNSFLGEYRCTQEGELAQLVAQHYYVSCGKVLLPEILSNLISEVIPEPLLRQKGTVYWIKLVTETFKKSYFIKLKIPEVDVKLDVVTFAKDKWPILLSKYYEVMQIAGISLGVPNLLLAINSEGIFFTRNTTKIILKFTYVEIASIEYKTDPDGEGQVHLLTFNDQKFVFKTIYAEIISHLIKWIQAELISRSIYAVALQNYSAPDSSFLSLSEGDLVILEEAVLDNFGGWLKGFKMGTDKIGEFPSSVVRILPTLSKPPNYVLAYCTNKHNSERYLTSKSILLKKHTLEEYAARHFSSYRTSRLMSKKNDSQSEPWKYSKSVIWGPLNKGLDQLAHLAINMFSYILKYSTDKDTGNKLLHTRPIFEPALDHVSLRDELYCQIMKQLTENPNPENENRMWHLMWLATCLFSCSEFLLPELCLFLETRPVSIAQESLKRLKIVREKGERRNVHHWIEVEAIEKETSILHKVSFPNGMEQIFKVNSFNIVDDLVKFIGAYLGLKSIEGFSLILSCDDNSTISLPPKDYLFDAILDACNFPQTASSQETPKYNYELVFVKKIWINTYPGVDKIADLVCHYNQELSKYMAGLHNCTLNDAIYLAAVIFIAEYSSEMTNPKDDILKVFVHLIPQNLQDELSGREWIEHIHLVFNKLKNMSNDEAKITFLKVVQTWWSFGSAFFNVHKLSSMQDDHLLLAVNKNGVFIIDPYSQEVLATYSYSQIIMSFCSKFSLTLTLTNGNLLLWTKNAHKIADLVNSYLDAYDNNRIMSSN
ncbi:myosin-VIIa-like isoform X2 [Cimex lectularius]|uniref:Uncharacterized protein n=1 Tax=Cimex lectularius TaxID=79782 RepID=A0A8I6RKE7_CIMLE|nr:myosin-VIIa-like isoform X2 [Cimex lectularius]